MRLIAILILLLFPSVAFSQYGKESGMWEFKELSSNPVQNSLLAIKVGDRPIGSCVYLGNNIFITAKHCVRNHRTGELFGNQSVFSPHLGVSLGKIKILKESSDEVDLAVFSVSEKIPETIKPIKVSPCACNRGCNLEFMGYAGFSLPRHFDCKLVEPADDKSLYLIHAIVIQGDSGGAILNKKGELVGILSKGMIELQYKKAYQFEGQQSGSPSHFAITLVVPQEQICRFLKDVAL